MSSLLPDKRKYKVGIIVGVVAFLLSLPLYISSYFQDILILIGIYSLVAMGLALLAGYAGQISLGHAAFFGIGAYVSAMLSVKLGLSPWLSLLCGVISSGLVAYLVGKPLLKLRGFALAVATGSFTIIFYVAVSRLEFVGARDGIGGIPKFAIGGLAFDKSLYFYYLLLVVITIVFLLIRNLINSQFGRMTASVDTFSGGSEVAAGASGVNVGKVKTQIFVIGCMLAGLGGGIYPHFMGHIDPGPFEPLYSAFFLLMAILGGVKSLWGGIVGATIYIGIREMLTYFFAGGAAAAAWQAFIFATILVLILLFLPGGLTSLPSRVAYGLRSKLSVDKRSRIDGMAS